LRYNFYVRDDAPNNQWKHLVQPTKRLRHWSHQLIRPLIF
jgi:hypothetical protein